MDYPEGYQGTSCRWCHSHWYVTFTTVAACFRYTNASADFEKTFIQAVVYNYTTLREYGDEGAVKGAGKIMTKGKDYTVEDGDIMLIKAGAAKG